MWMDAALVLLYLQDINVLNYLDDWVFPAQLKARAASHLDAVLACAYEFSGPQFEPRSVN